MEKFSIESKIKDRLKSHSELIDTDDLLKSMGIDQEEDKKRGFIWWIGVGVVSSVFLFYFFMPSSNENVFQNQNIINVTNKKVENDQIDNKNQSKEIGIIETIELKENTNIETLKPSSNVYALDTEFKTSDTKIISMHQFSSSTMVDSRNKVEEVILSKSSSTEHTIFQKSTQSKKLSELIVVTKTIIDNENTILDINIQKLKTTTINIPRYDDSLSCNLFYDFVTDQELKHNPSWSILGSFGLSKYEKDFKAKNDRAKPFLEFVETNEEELEGLSINLSLKHQWRSNWYVKAGVEYQRYNSKYNYQEYLKDSSVIENKTYHVNYNGDTTLNSISTNNAIISRNWNLYNRHNLFSIPIIIGYEHQFNSFSWFLEGGLATSFYSLNKGTNHDKLYQLVKNHQYFRPSLVLQVNIAAGLSYQFNPFLKLWINTNISTSLNSITRSSYLLEEKYNHFGLKVGFEYKL